jgi:predicted enzyme involved in methoxymalonyl-ACP biosynthesis
LDKIAADAGLDSMTLSCVDIYGDYGIIGFSIVDRKMALLTDLMFSCRIQGKRIEHAFLTFLLKKYLDSAEEILSPSTFTVRYRPTKRNAASAQVFDDFKFQSVSEKNGIKWLSFAKGTPILDDQLVDVAVK